MPIVVIATLVFIAIASVLLFVIYVALPRKTVVEERIDSMTPYYTDEIIFVEKPPTRWQKFLGRLGANVPMRQQDLGKYQRQFIAAGMKKERVPIFLGVMLISTITLPGLYLFLYGIPIEKDPQIRFLVAVGLAIVGIWMPIVWLRYKLNSRRTQIFHDLPDLLDLMTVCVEAGLSMDAAMIKVCDDEQFKKSPLARELRIALQETRAGKPRLEALRDMGERAMVDDLKAFAAMLIQTERLGTSLAQSLRIFSDSLRTERRQIAEEAAAKTAIKLMFPLVFFIFPALLVVILGPAMLRIMAFFKDL
jgi:tight adherence protein C